MSKQKNLVKPGKQLIAVIFIALLVVVLGQFASALTSVTPVLIEQKDFVLKEGGKIDGLHGFKLLECQKVSVALNSITAAGPNADSYLAKFNLLDEKGSVAATATAVAGQDLGSLFQINSSNALSDSVLINSITVSAETGVGEASVTVTHAHSDTCSVPAEPEKIFVGLGEKFSLLKNQTAEIKGEGLEIRLDKIFTSYCTEWECVEVLSTVYLTVTKTSSDTGTTTGISTQIKLDRFQKSASVFGYTIENTFIEEGKAGFVVSKETVTPKDVFVKFGEQFSLVKGQTARFLKDGKEIAKMSLDRILIIPKNFCIPEEPCPIVEPWAVVLFTNGEKGATSFSIRGGEKIDVFEKYSVAALDVTPEKASFTVIELPKVEIIIAKLGQDFDLQLNQTDTIAGTFLQVRFLEWNPIYCITTPCPQQAVFEVKKTDGGKLIITISEGETKDIRVPFADPEYQLTLNFLKTGEDQKSSIANLRVSKIPDTPKPSTVYALLDEKFKLSVDQTGVIQDEFKNSLLKLHLDKITSYSCASNQTSTDSSTKCYSTPLAGVSVFVANGAGETFLLSSGQERQIGGYTVRVLAIDQELKSAQFIVSKAVKEIKTVYPNEKFSMGQKDTVFVLGPDFFLRVDEIALWGGKPEQYLAYVSVWKNIYKNEESPSAKLKMREGETAEFFDAQIQLLDLSAQKAVFLVSVKKEPKIITVYTNEPFWLKENQSAKVIPANIQIELLGINETITCPNSNDGTSSNAPCKVSRSVEIGVGNYIFGEESVGKIIPQETAQEIAVTTTQDISQEKVSAVIIPQPPFAVYTIYEGQELSINDYTIKVLGIQADKAELIVKQKGSSFEVHYSIYSGWNLFSMPGSLEAFENTCDTTKWRLFEYDSQGKVFKKIKNPSAGKAYWLYNSEEFCFVNASILTPLSVKDIHPLNKGWNFVPATVDMVG
ncbi:MAG: hypothetical protein HYW50_03595, partial [Candidatus Diapherotrites archaeon]|nr:hypothetical protein [Candidatus Diapherotrites archaeon]